MVQCVVQKGQGAKAADLKCPSPRTCECLTLGARGFPFCNSRVLSKDGGAESVRLIP